MAQLERSQNDAAEGKVTLTRKDARDAARLFELLAKAVDEVPAGAGPGALPSHRSQLVSRARSILSGRQLRQVHFHRAMFGEPAWEIMLLLYIMETEGDRQTPSKLAAWTGTPLSTTVRWLDYLEKKQLVSRQGHPNDKRVVFISLLERARDAMDAYLSGLAWTEGEG